MDVGAFLERSALIEIMIYCGVDVLIGGIVCVCVGVCVLEYERVCTLCYTYERRCAHVYDYNPLMPL